MDFKAVRSFEGTGKALISGLATNAYPHLQREDGLHDWGALLGSFTNSAKQLDSLYANMEPILALSVPTPKKPTQPPNYSIPDLLSTNIGADETSAIILPDSTNFSDNKSDWERINSHNESVANILEDYNRLISDLRSKTNSSSSNSSTLSSSSFNGRSGQNAQSQAQARALIAKSLR